MNILYKRLGFKDLLLQMNYASEAMRRDLATFQTFITTANGKASKVKNFWASILTAKSKWVVNMFLRYYSSSTPDLKNIFHPLHCP
jgi:hypothetical protein